MTPQTFSEWWKVSCFPSSDRSVAYSSWRACEINQPTFETLVAQLGQADAENLKLRSALRQLYDETAEYITINHLGDAHHNQSMQMAREALNL